ncbi:MAG: tetratricopeptide repeat protein [Planctomycetes bacterium]|nr:tetratricopeptide repeat protein [Planctomycetota bacterium]
MRMSRIILIVLVVLVLGVLASGAWYVFVYRASGDKLLKRAGVALAAKQYDKAIDLARRYAARNPDDRRAVTLQARAHSALGRYEQARELLQDAAKQAPGDVDLALAIADTFTMPAREVLRSDDRNLPADKLWEVAHQLTRALTALEDAAPADGPAKARVNEAAGLARADLGSTKQRLVRALEREAEVYVAAGQQGPADAKIKEADRAKEEAEEAFQQATALLLEVLTWDAAQRQGDQPLAHPVAANTLVALAANADRRDTETLAKARDVILALPDPPLPAATLLIIDPIEDPGAEPDEEQVRDACRQLDALLERHGDDPAALQVRLARARLALGLGDLDQVADLCATILKTQPRQADARLLQAMARLEKGDAAQAEKDLFALKTDVPGSPAVHFRYAQAALRTGKRELAKEALRKITALDRTHAGAHGMLAEMLLEEGFADEAFKEAKELYDAYPANPEALNLLARTAARMGQPILALDALDAAAKDFPDNATIQATLADGYRLLGEAEKAKAAAEKAAGITPTTISDRLAKAQALMRLGKTAEAEQLLTAIVAEQPQSAGAHALLGNVYASTGRVMQAADQYREAVTLVPQNVRYRLLLAHTLLAADLADEAAEEVREALARDPTNPEATALAGRIRVLRGQPLDVDTLVAAPGAAPTGLPLAQACLARGQVEQCIEICQTFLEKTPDDADALWLLGRAHLALGRPDECIRQWTLGLKADPQRIEFYQGLAQVLGRDKKPAEIEAALAAIPGADRNLTDLAVGSMLREGGRFAEAAGVFGRVVERPGAPADHRNVARLRQAECLSLAGQTDEAVAALDAMPKDATWNSRTQLAKAMILANAGRADPANAVLEDLLKTARDEPNPSILGRIGLEYLRTGRNEQALALADEMAGLFPKTVDPLVLRAAALERLGQGDDVIACLREIVALEPGNFGHHVRLARALDLHQRPKEALAAVAELRKHGPTGETLALLEEGALLAQWGLQGPALARLQELIGRDDATTPRVRILVAQALATFGDVPKARDQLAKVPTYASEYVVAQQLLARLAETEEERLAILEQAAAGQPATGQAAAGLVLERMDILMAAGRPADAAKAFTAWANRLPEGAATSGSLARRAIDAMLAAGDREAATALAVRTARQGDNTAWRRLAALLAVRDDPATAESLLPPIQESGPMDAVLGLVVASGRGGDLGPWLERMAEIDRISLDLRRLPGIPPAYRVLALVAAGDTTAAARHGMVPAGQTSVVPAVMLELIASTKTDPAIKGEATQLIMAALANDFGLRDLGHAWAMEALGKRPHSQWSAAIAAEGAADPARLRAILDVLKPPDCLIGRVIQATALAQEGKHDEAAAAFEAVIKDHGATPQLRMNQATATEKAGRLAEALVLYSQLWDETRDPSAANNAAYLVSRLYPADEKRLTLAAGWAASAVEGRPTVAAFRDTKGWIHYLLGQNQDACRELRTAVKGIPASPEAHYHLGLAEKKAGDMDMARWHLEAAVQLAETAAKDAAGKETPAKDAPGAEAARLARQALEELPKAGGT